MQELKELEGIWLARSNRDPRNAVEACIQSCEQEDENTVIFSTSYRRKYSQLITKRKTDVGYASCGWGKENKGCGVRTSVEVRLYDKEHSHMPKITLDSRCGEESCHATLGVLDGRVAYFDEELEDYTLNPYRICTYHEGKYGKGYEEAFNLLAELVRLRFQEAIDVYEEW